MSYIPSSHLLVLPRLRVQNANAISSPLTHGFPSITAFMGLMWALERKLKQAGLDLQLNAIGVVCHNFQELVTESNFIKAFRLTRNPVDKTGKTAAIVEEGRIHLEVSLIIGVSPLEWHDEYLTEVPRILHTMRLAGGTFHPQEKPWLTRYQPRMFPMTGGEEGQSKSFRDMCRALLPGFALVARDDLVDQRLEELRNEDRNAGRLDAWLSWSRINWRYQVKSEDGKGEWRHDRTGRGWVVPIPVGYGALGPIQPAGSVLNARDRTTPFRFVESLYSLGEWVSPHRLSSVEQLLWYADSQPDKGLYRCRNNFHSTDNTYDR